ncbi:ATP-binding protein [Guyparkeria hydrothermalis]|uniref:ATP-binding protein n=1 Tax=Guyparkeria TaxID=2035712 RepID=UPI0010ACB1D0|nr:MULTISPECIES: ATP-binding protein [Guyparkeria]MCL7750594.1 ATP-binding protein [Guyparkeria hydrothermalis]TKA88309.1 ATP-binding protein [Guyparkeria sp. SB14A]
MDEVKSHAHAYPTKKFFVRMITRDIDLKDCILDLIDNSVDNAWAEKGGHIMSLRDTTDLSDFEIHINITNDCFSIRDNCGGMTLDSAVDHAFNFGRKEFSPNDNYSIGVYGIGMKRAVFKIGREAEVRSTYDEGGERSSFKVPINVDEWVHDDAPPWDFDIEESSDLGENGVEIVIQELTEEAESEFSSPEFLADLRWVIERDYTLHLHKGLNIFLNGKRLTGWRVELRQSENFRPMRAEYNDISRDNEVVVEMVGGMVAPPPESVDPDEDSKGDRLSGWYVACNGRIVLAADKTETTGWGAEGFPSWHKQYSGFIGIVLFSAQNAAALPLTTTKRNVNSSADLYRRARARMQEVSRAWIDYTNQRKRDTESARHNEEASRAVSIYDIAPREQVQLPEIEKKPVVPMANVSYSVPKTKLKKLAREMGNVTMSYRDVGQKSFEYAYEDYVGED